METRCPVGMSSMSKKMSVVLCVKYVAFVPAPMILIPRSTFIDVDGHVADPAGIFRVSPF
jgi:hypothetical protein